MTIVPPIPDVVDRGVLEKEAAEVATSGGLTVLIDDEVLTYSVDGTTFEPVPATITVVSSTQITATFDTRNALADTSYYLAVWNPPGPQKSNSNVTFKVASTTCP